MKREYLPSRQFIARIVILVIILGVIFGIYEIVSFLKNRSRGNNPVKLQVKDIVQQDTNKNGIPDWEESLWGLDPNTNGPANKEFILAKRKALAENSDPATIDDGNPTTDNEALAREFFAVVMSLEQTGNLDASSMQSISEAVGKKIAADPIPDIYKKDMLIIKGDTPVEILEYYGAYLTLNNKYRGKNIGDEMTFIAAALKDNDKGALKVVGTIGEAYRAFGKELIKVPVPNTLASVEVDLANNYEKVAVSIDGLTKLLDEPIVGMKALINYKKYSDLLLEDIGKISDNSN